MFLALAVLPGAAAAVTLAACGFDDASQNVNQCHGHDAEHYNRLYDRRSGHNKFAT